MFRLTVQFLLINNDEHSAPMNIFVTMAIQPHPYRTLQLVKRKHFLFHVHNIQSWVTFNMLHIKPTFFVPSGNMSLLPKGTVGPFSHVLGAWFSSILNVCSDFGCTFVFKEPAGSHIRIYG